VLLVPPLLVPPLLVPPLEVDGSAAGTVAVTVAGVEGVDALFSVKIE
jgi:hypothetical protein